MVTNAIEALSNFGAITRKQAETLLQMWAHYDQLTTAEVKQVLRAFP